ncbi:hypothetical protein ACWD62_27235 [Streptomyces sp. NPDC005146]
MIEIRDNLLDRIAEAQREGWIGEAEGLEISRILAETEQVLFVLFAHTVRRHQS